MRNVSIGLMLSGVLVFLGNRFAGFRSPSEFVGGNSKADSLRPSRMAGLGQFGVALVGSSWAYDPGEYIRARLRLTANGTWENGSAWLNSTQIAPQDDFTASMRCQLNLSWRNWPRRRYGHGLPNSRPNCQFSASRGLLQFLHRPSLAIDVTTWNGGVHTDAMRVFENGTQIASWSLGTNVENTGYYNLFATYTAATHQLAVRYQGDGLDTTDYVTTDLGGLIWQPGGDVRLHGGYRRWYRQSRHHGRRTCWHDSRAGDTELAGFGRHDDRYSPSSGLRSYVGHFLTVLTWMRSR